MKYKSNNVERKNNLLLSPKFNHDSENSLKFLKKTSFKEAQNDFNIPISPDMNLTCFDIESYKAKDCTSLKSIGTTTLMSCSAHPGTYLTPSGGRPASSPTRHESPPSRIRWEVWSIGRSLAQIPNEVGKGCSRARLGSDPVLEKEEAVYEGLCMIALML